MKFLTHNIATGEIVPMNKDLDDADYKRAIYTIELLNLNETNLLGKRKTMHLSLSYLIGSSKEEFEGNLELYTEDNRDFPSIIKHHLDNYDAF